MTRPAVQNVKMELRRCFLTERESVLPTPCTSTFIWGINDSIGVVATSAAWGAGSRCRVLYLGRPEGLRVDEGCSSYANHQRAHRGRANGSWPSQKCE